jgi:hypothetical protein
MFRPTLDLNACQLCIAEEEHTAEDCRAISPAELHSLFSQHA